MDWSDTPDLATVYDTLMRRGQVKAKLKPLTTELKRIQSRIALQHPRNKNAQVVGMNDEDEQTLRELQDHIASLEAELEQLDELIHYLNYHKDMFKTLATKARY